MTSAFLPVVDSSIFEDVANRWPLAATAAFACVVGLVLQNVLKTDPWADLPMVGTEFGGTESRRRKFLEGSARDLYLDGYKKASCVTNGA